MRGHALLLFTYHKGDRAVLDKRDQAGINYKAFMVGPLAAEFKQSGKGSACNFCAMMLLMGCATVLLAQLRTSPSLRCPQMPYDAHVPFACVLVSQTGSELHKQGLP